MNKKLLIRYFILVLPIFLISFLISLPVSAQQHTLDITVGSIEIGQGNGNTIKVSQNGNTYSLESGTEILINGNNTETTNYILITDDISINLSLQNVIIKNPEFLKSPLNIFGNNTVRLTVYGSNELTAGPYVAGLQLSKNASLTIEGSGTLNVTGGSDAAGIGGGWRSGAADCNTGNIEIKGNVCVKAQGGSCGAGIGGGIDGSVNNITISGNARVFAIGGYTAAGIGGGKNGSSESILICGKSYVEAKSDNLGAGIGSGSNADSYRIEICENAQVRAQGSENSPAIGAGSLGNANEILIFGNAKVHALGGNEAAAIGTAKEKNTTKISITDSAKVYVHGSNNAAAIGTGTGGKVESLEISGNAYIIAYGGENAAAIGTGFKGTVSALTITGDSYINAYGGINGAGIGSGLSGSFNTITISKNAKVNAIGGKYSPGIGVGKDGIPGSVVIADSANVVAQGGNFGAGIGGSAKKSADSSIINATITISGSSKVFAYGGKYASGIGGGVLSSGFIVTIKDSSVVESHADFEINFVKQEDKLTDPSEPRIERYELQPVLINGIDYFPAGNKLLFYTSLFDTSYENSIIPIIEFIPDYPKINAQGSDNYSVESVSAKDVGNGAGCQTDGSCFIADKATLNGREGDVTVTLVMGEGANDLITSINKNDFYTLPKNPVKNGYKFIGWYKDAAFTKPAPSEIVVYENISIYAKWEIIPVTFQSGTLENAFYGQEYNYQLSASGGSGKHTYLISSGSLPAGLSLDENTGLISGVPKVIGKYDFTVSVKDENLSVITAVFTINVYSSNTYKFTFKTSGEEGADTTGDILFYFSYKDRSTGEIKYTEKENITQKLLAKTGNAFALSSVNELIINYESNVGQPIKLYFENLSDDDWKCESVNVRFESTNEEFAPSFEKLYEIDKWITKDNTSGLFTNFILFSPVIAVVAVVGYYYIKKNRRRKIKKIPSGNNRPKAK